MLVTVAETPTFVSQAAKLLSDIDRVSLIDAIARAPQSGVLIKGSGGLRKLRVGLENRGKRSGARVVYWFHSPNYPAVLLWILAKNVASDLTPDQARKVRAMADSLLETFGAT